MKDTRSSNSSINAISIELYHSPSGPIYSTRVFDYAFEDARSFLPYTNKFNGATYSKGYFVNTL